LPAAINHPPVAVDHTYTTNEDTALSTAAPGVLQGATDPDGATTFTAVVVSNVQHGTLTLNADGSFLYTPTANYYGTDSFTYKAKDAQNAESAAANVTITVGAIGLLCSRVFVQESVVQSVLFKVKSWIGRPNRMVPLTPAQQLIKTQTQTIIFNAPLCSASVNDAPVAVNHTYSVTEDATYTESAPGVLVCASDVDGPTPTVAVLVSTTQHGTLTLNTDGSFTYTPAANFFGTDSFTYKAKDAQNAESATATVTITVGAFGY
jgi:VCBS repeat-containing protein